ncbi:hypothetical protein CLF_109310 [Clonorchis sinensis]|uniref:Uncharacterized protein n=1 Tax=Clonorchis sinensis TaxID=79923 RepID=G7YJ76_CLOSI|nr:hypothetical protein CLF_109310 [Clonorchis sinensis]
MSHKHRLASEDVTLDLQSVIQSFNEDPQEKNEAKEAPAGLFRVPEIAPQGQRGGLPRPIGRTRDQNDPSFCEPEHERESQLRTQSRSPTERSERDALLHNIAKLLSKDAAKSRPSSTVLSEVSGKKHVRETRTPCSPHPTRFPTGLKRNSVDILARLHSVVTEAYEQAKYDEELTTVLGSLLGYGSHIHTVGRQTELEFGGRKRREFDCRPFQGPKTPPSPNSKHKTGILSHKRRTKASCGLRESNEPRSDNYIERIRVDPRNRILNTKSAISHRHLVDPHDYLHSFEEEVSKVYCKPHRSQHSPHGRTHGHTIHHHITRDTKDQFVNLHEKRLHGSSCECGRKLKCTGCMLERQSSRTQPSTRTHLGSKCRSPFRNSQRRSDDRITDEPTEQQTQKRRAIGSCSPGCSKHLRRHRFSKTERDFDGIQVRASNLDAATRDLLHHTNTRPTTVVELKTVGNSSRQSTASISGSPSPTRSGSFRHSYRCKAVLHRILQDSPDQHERSPIPIRKKPYGHNATQGWADTKDQAACSKRPTNYVSSVTEKSCDNRSHLHRVSKRRQIHYLGPPSPYTVACSFRADDLLADTPESPDQAKYNEQAINFVQTEQDISVDTTQSNPTFSERYKTCNIDLSSYNNAELRRLKNWILFGKPAQSSPPSPQPGSGDKPSVEFAVPGMTPRKISSNKCELKQSSKEPTPVPNCSLTEPKTDQSPASGNPRPGTELRSPSVSSTSSTSSSQSSNSSSSGSSESAETSTTNDTTCISSTPSEGSRPETPTPVSPDKLLANSFSTRQQHSHANNIHEVGEPSQKEVSSATENNHSVNDTTADLLVPAGADKHEVQMDSSGRDVQQIQEQNANHQPAEEYCSTEFKVSCPFAEENGEVHHGENENIMSNGNITQSVEVNPCSPRSEPQEYDPTLNMAHVDETTEEETVFCDETVSGNLVRSPKKNKLEKRRRDKNSTSGHDRMMDNEACADRIDGVLQNFETRTSADEEEGEVISDCTSDVDEYHLSKRLRRTPIQEADSTKLSTTSSSEVLRPKMVCRSDIHKHVGSRRSNSSENLTKCRRRTEESRFKQPSTPKRKRRDRFEVERLRTSVDNLREQSGFCDRYRKAKYIRSNYLDEPIAYDRKTHQQNLSRSNCILKLNRGRPDLDKFPTRGRYLLSQPDSLSRGRGRRMYAQRCEFESDYQRGTHQNRAFQRSIARSVTRFRTSRTFAKPGITHRHMFDLREHKLSRKHQ